MDEEPRKARSNITGTMLFMSITLEYVPLHQAWHDLESFYWVWVYMIIHHVSGLTLKGKPLNAIGRKERLDLIFGPTTLEGLSLIKRATLAHSIHIEGYPELGEGLRAIRTRLEDLYGVLEKLSDVDSDLEKHGTKFDSQHHYYTSLALDTRDAHYSSKSLEDL
ncbi:hypothetical protein PIIN_10709 [Serendipita indica DSM 11827]|uniref:Fungal-type protein kinase domain-containing protein n=1 Tax=Serendipita indica (strain DSM 11827) TaxID=1109443 RepID=G4TZH8_SERID|nr:hypothetical protein PIIN_10709 [Serendipita indica DSM 11827]